MSIAGELKEKPIEFFIAKATDPYVGDAERRIYAEKLCEKVNYEIEGAQVKDQATKMLFSWQSSMAHIEKFKEVYDSLKERGIIAADPVLEVEMPTVPAPPPKFAVFEDEEKARLLKELLQSKNPEDLHTANRLIKNLVRTEDQKVEKRNKRSDDLDQTVQLCHLMEAALRNGPTTHSLADLHDHLSELRPIMFKYANEAAENSDEALAEILQINDTINRLLHDYEAQKAKRRGRAGSSSTAPSTTQVDLFDDVPIPLPNPKTCRLSDSGVRTTHHNLSAVSFPTRIRIRPEKKPPLDLSDFTALDDIFAPRPPPPSFHQPKPTLFELSQAKSVAPLSLSPLEPISNASSAEFDETILSSPVRCLPESVSFSEQQMQLSVEQPISIMERKNVKILLHYSQNSPPGTTGVRAGLISILNFNTHPVQNIKFLVYTNDMRISCRLLWKDCQEIDAFSALGSTPHKRAILLVLPLDSRMTEAEFTYTISYTDVFEETITGTFVMNV
ncbi:unnamed protein product, partial [Mesorhabditis spiculigera]